MKKFLCALLAVLAAFAVFAVSAPDMTSVYAQGETRYAKKKIYLFAKKSTSSDKLCSIAKGDEMTLIETSGSWASVEYEDASGAEYAGYVKKANISKTATVDVTPTPTPEATDDPETEPTPTPTVDPEATPTPSPSMSPVRPGGGGGRPGGSGGSSSTSEQSVTDQLGITPGKALTSDHASGSYSSLLYGAVSLKVSSQPMTELTLGSSALDITLTQDSGLASFTAKLYSQGEKETLLLEGVDEAESLSWHMSGLALETLYKSGVDTIILKMGGQGYACLETSNVFSGVGYDAVRASGVPESNIGLDIETNSDSYAIYAVVNGVRRELNLYDDKVFYANSLAVVDALNIENAEG